ncbi:hypothetical protein GCM10011391_12240 [Pullulanibacillus camelliae]|uniref:Uncharacterized protein n=1 Tax=Pullulanibacillus camelliae TaxID=1707096 RepID=A0A8J2YDS6_9BACL|nr:hypothetical protein [Pullulanibacillus camelliae]GGE35075.1 hypothetical protein GCM10011391_12240 [Pullulanibacillus camelliae]
MSDSTSSWRNQDPLELNERDWLMLLNDQNIFDKTAWRMINFVYDQLNCQSSATEIGEALGGVSQQQVTAWNRKISKKIYTKLNKEPPNNSRGGQRYWNVLFDGDDQQETDESGFFIWRLRPDLVSALRKLDNR